MRLATAIRRLRRRLLTAVRNCFAACSGAFQTALTHRSRIWRAHGRFRVFLASVVMAVQIANLSAFAYPSDTLEPAVLAIDAEQPLASHGDRGLIAVRSRESCPLVDWPCVAWVHNHQESR
jgi:hypothetical protein